MNVFWEVQKHSITFIIKLAHCPALSGYFIHLNSYIRLEKRILHVTPFHPHPYALISECFSFHL